LKARFNWPDKGGKSSEMGDEMGISALPERAFSGLSERVISYFD
jgi:hypothetical protein